tara:strand:- start:2137 stop:2535 length:399 start_codon:yes stop_codon:yes gene_type:complete
MPFWKNRPKSPAIKAANYEKNKEKETIKNKASHLPCNTDMLEILSKNKTGLDWTSKPLKGVIVFTNGDWQQLADSRVVLINPDSIGASIILNSLEYSHELDQLLRSGEAQEISVSELVEFYLKNEVYPSSKS